MTGLVVVLSVELVQYTVFQKRKPPNFWQ